MMRQFERHVRIRDKHEWFAFMYVKSVVLRKRLELWKGIEAVLCASGITITPT